MNEKQITITESDRDRLGRFIELAGRDEPSPYLDALMSELNRAVVVAPDRIPPDIITMNSTVSLVDDDAPEEEVFTLVFPKDADVDAGKISVTAPLGTAMLGCRAGDTFEWDVPIGRKRWRVAQVRYQPEAAGDRDL